MVEDKVLLLSMEIYVTEFGHILDTGLFFTKFLHLAKRFTEFRIFMFLMVSFSFKTTVYFDLNVNSIYFSSFLFELMKLDVLIQIPTIQMCEFVQIQPLLVQMVNIDTSYLKRIHVTSITFSTQCARARAPMCIPYDFVVGYKELDKCAIMRPEEPSLARLDKDSGNRLVIEEWQRPVLVTFNPAVLHRFAVCGSPILMTRTLAGFSQLPISSII